MLFIVEMEGKSKVMDVKIKKGVSLFKQLPWVEQMEGIRKYVLNPKYPTACYPECVTGEKKKDFREIMKNFKVDNAGKLLHLHRVKKLYNNQWASKLKSLSYIQLGNL